MDSIDAKVNDKNYVVEYEPLNTVEAKTKCKKCKIKKLQTRMNKVLRITDEHQHVEYPMDDYLGREIIKKAKYNLSRETTFCPNCDDSDEFTYDYWDDF